jgi:transposase-like protein
VDFVYLWVDGIHVNVRLEQEKLCLLVMIRVRADGRKELVALTDGYRESTESWADLLRDCKRRGMRAPVLAMGDGALGFWAALREVFPQTKEQRCWFHKMAPVGSIRWRLSLHRCRSRRIRRQRGRCRRSSTRRTVTMPRSRRRHSRSTTARSSPKAAAKIIDDLDVLLEFYNYPAEHWVHFRTTNPIESTFATVRHRSRVTKGPGSRAAGLAMASSSSRPHRVAGER